jgi:hypothetical protein
MCAVLLCCSCTSYKNPVSMHASCRIGPEASQLRNSTSQVFLVAKTVDNAFVLCTQDSEDSCTASVTDTLMNVQWRTTVPIPDDNEHLSLIVRNDTVSLIFDNEIGDTIFVDRRNISRTSGAASPTNSPYVKVLDNESISVIQDPLLQHSMLRSQGYVLDSVNSDNISVYWQNIRLLRTPTSGITPAQHLAVSKSRLRKSEILDHATGSYVVASVRDSMTAQPNKVGVRYIETSIINGNAVQQHRFPISVTLESATAEDVVPYLGICNNALQLHTVAMTDDNNIASISRYDFTGSDWKRTWSRDFSEEECEKIDNDLDWEDASIHGIHQLSSGTLLFIEEVHPIQSGYPNPAAYLPPAHHTYMPVSMPSSFRYDAVMSASSIEKSISSYSATYVLMVFIANDGKVRWHSPLYRSREPSEKDDKHKMISGSGDDGRVLLGSERNGRCPMLWRDYSNGLLYAGYLDVTTGTIEERTAVMSIDNKAVWYGLSWINDHTLMFFTYVYGGFVVPVQIDMTKISHK